MTLLLLLSCSGPAKEDPTPGPGGTTPETDTDTDADTDTDTDTDTEPMPEVLVSGRVTGALAASANVVVAVVDASNWRFGDAPDGSELVSWTPGEGAFTLRLETLAITDVYAKGFVAAWEDLDADGRFDFATEALCDEAGEGWDGAALTYRSDRTWAVGVEQAHSDDLATYYTPVLDGDRCSR